MKNPMIRLKSKTGYRYLNILSIREIKPIENCSIGEEGEHAIFFCDGTALSFSEEEILVIINAIEKYFGVIK